MRSTQPPRARHVAAAPLAALLAVLLAGCAGVQLSGNTVGTGSGSSVGVAGDLQTETGRQSHPEQITRLEIDSDSGDVVVRPGAGRGAVVQHTLRWSGTKPELTEVVQDGALRITARCPDGDGGDRCQADLTVTVPAATAVRTQLGAGGITVSDLAGDQDLGSSAGTVTASGLRAPTVTARSRAGAVELEFAAPPQSVDAESSAGAVRVFVPREGPVYRVQATTNAGKVDVQVPDDPGAGPGITARSSAGSVTVGYR